MIRTGLHPHFLLQCAVGTKLEKKNQGHELAIKMDQTANSKVKLFAGVARA